MELRGWVKDADHNGMSGGITEPIDGLAVSATRMQVLGWGAFRPDSKRYIQACRGHKAPPTVIT